jgi:glycosyltransferase involved in cell wall biosynthesis
MKVLVPFIHSDSGNDVYFRDLKSGLLSHHVTVELMHFHPYVGFMPRLASSSFMRRARSGTCNLIHSNADYGDIFRVPSRPFVVTVHHNVFEKNYQCSTSVAQKAYHFGLLRRRFLRSMEAADKIVAVSHSTRKSLERMFGAGDVEVIYNGIDADVFRPIPVARRSEDRSKIRLLFVGNLTRRKGADLLPEIMRRLGGDYVLLYTAGLRPKRHFDGPNMIALGVTSRADLIGIYNSCDIFLFPSRLEGFGYAVAEAMACGKPVVCTNGSSLPELVVEQKGGFLCEQDHVEQFVEKISCLAGREELRLTMGEFNRRRILENFTVKHMAERYFCTYRDLLNVSRDQRPPKMGRV